VVVLVVVLVDDKEVEVPVNDVLVVEVMLVVVVVLVQSGPVPSNPVSKS